MLFNIFFLSGQAHIDHEPHLSLIKFSRQLSNGVLRVKSAVSWAVSVLSSLTVAEADTS